MAFVTPKGCSTFHDLSSAKTASLKKNMQKTGRGGFKENAPLLRKQGAMGILTNDEKRRVLEFSKTMNMANMSLKKHTIPHHILKLLKEVPREKGTYAEKWAKKWLKDEYVNERWCQRFLK